MAKQLICDTNFYYFPCESILNDPEIEIVGTALNAWELIATFKFNPKHFHVLQAAINNFLSIPKSYRIHPPFAEAIDRKVGPKGIAKDDFLWRYKRGILIDIASFDSYEEFDNPDGANKFAEYDHNERNTAAEYFNEYFTSFRKRYDQNAINGYMKDREEIGKQTKPILFFIIKEIIARDYDRIVTPSMIDWLNRSFLSEVLIDFNIEYLSGKRGADKNGVKIDPNDINDLFMTIYVDRNTYYHTNERFWRVMCQDNPILSSRFIPCDHGYSKENNDILIDLKTV